MSNERKYGAPKRPEPTSPEPDRSEPFAERGTEAAPGLHEASSSPFHTQDKAEARTVHPADIKNQGTTLDAVPQQSREGPYLLTIGRTGSGKTTFHWQLMRWLISTPLVAAKVAAPENNWDGAAILTEWEQNWDAHEFPRSTQQFQPQEIIVEINPYNKKLPSLRFGFFEIAGEDFRYLEPKSGQAPMIYKGLLNFLENSSIHFMLAFVCDGEEPKGSDLLFTNIMTWLDQTFNQAFRMSPILLLITKPEIALENLQRAGNAKYRMATELDTESFVDEFLPNTKSLMQEWGAPYALTKFSVGSVEHADDENNRFIRNVDYSDIQTIFFWLYKQATGSEFGETPMQKFVRYIRELFT